VFWEYTYTDYENKKDYFTENCLEISLLIINSILTFEIVVKSIGFGLWMDEGAYLTYIWKIPEIIYLAGYFMSLAGLEYYKLYNFFLYFAYLRPMKILYRIRSFS